jgi:16S rRNA G966 N2-methylase RsmD
VFAETDAAACRVIRQNLESLGFTGALVLQRDAVSVLREERSGGRRHDLVLLDPPYGRWGSLEPLLAALLPNVVAAAGIVVVETDAQVEPSLPLDLVTTRRYGSARLTLFAP